MPKPIDGSVGRGGRSFPAKHVLTVQYLLNCVPAGSGGPQPELVMDGICGPKTIKAIETFQRQNLGFADGRVDRGGRTLQALQQFDPAVRPGPRGRKRLFPDLQVGATRLAPTPPRALPMDTRQS